MLQIRIFVGNQSKDLQQRSRNKKIEGRVWVHLSNVSKNHLPHSQRLFEVTQSVKDQFPMVEPHAMTEKASSYGELQNKVLSMKYSSFWSVSILARERKHHHCRDM